VRPRAIRALHMALITTKLEVVSRMAVNARRRPRRGIVLGAGGVLGAAWMVGALVAVEEVLDVDVRDYDEILGISAGSTLAALIGCGVSVTDVYRHQQGGEIVGPLAGRPWDYDDVIAGAWPPWPQPRIGAGGMLVRNVGRLRRMPPATVLAALTPLGRGSLHRVGELVAAVTPASGWAPREGVTVVALDYDSGRRVLFGRPGAPRPPLPRAVMASCAIPGWFAPQRIDGRRYVDGGAWSPTSADLMTGLGLDEVVVVAPTTGFGAPPARSVLARMERRWRAAVTRRCLNEAAKLQAEGTRVTILGCGPEDVATIGTNVMDVSRRLNVLETARRTQRAVLAAGTADLAHRVQEAA
jgi:NTE family protein